MINDASLLVDTVSAVMRLEEMRAQVAARNIAMANVPGGRAERFDAALQYNKLRSAVSEASRLAGEVASLRQLRSSDLVWSEAAGVSPSLDSQVLEMSAASARYQALGEGVSRQFALMRLAIGGGR